ncbi:T6SS immunity protein Tli4 family protein [Janthinobacterium sp. RB2P8]|uniref:T6SS immunity protein Tli4 family protein n=1 Tax=Janthinobacterium sp. RB2P8 TaxID=3424191 RepID=UPI003F27D052
MLNYKKILIIAIIALPSRTMANETIPSKKHEENKMHTNTIPIKKIENLFQKTKKLCFGRYLLNLPNEAELIIGNSEVELFKGGPESLKHQAEVDLKKIRSLNISPEIIYNGNGPIENSWQLRYYNSKSAKEDNFIIYRTLINKGNFIFAIGDAVDNGDTERATAERQFLQAKSLRLRATEEIPVTPGLCVEHGFISENQYKYQEIDDVGIFLPSLPDVTFSISSNKDAYGDYPPTEFESRLRGELSLLSRIQDAKKMQGNHYPKRTLLREGKRNVQHWKGEESLIRRTDGVHDFEWAFVGKPKDIANPSVLEVKMYTKVAHNMVGAAEAASLTDEEAIALWDKLLSGLKFRVKVPGAPPGSYYIDPDKPAQ